MKTVTIQIGNSDNKLTQEGWADFVRKVRVSLDFVHGVRVHFFGASTGYEPWQNAAWVVECPDYSLHLLRMRLVSIRKEFSQDSVAWTEGATEFV